MESNTDPLSDSLEQAAKEISDQLWYTVEPDRLRVKNGGMWNGLCDPSRELRVPEPWYWVFEGTHDRIEINRVYLRKSL
jgi:hypothetical protein